MNYQKGKTVAMLRQAMRAAAKPDNVLVVAADSRHVANIIRTLRLLDPTGKVESRERFIPSTGGCIFVRFSGQTLLGMRVTTFTDHYARERAR